MLGLPFCAKYSLVFVKYLLLVTILGTKLANSRVPDSPTTTVAVINNTAILVQWVPSPRDSCGREINGYVIVYGKLTEMGLLTDSMVTRTIPNADRRFIILRVDPGVTYGVSVGAFARNFAGPISDPKFITTGR